MFLDSALDLQREINRQHRALQPTVHPRFDGTVYLSVSSPVTGRREIIKSPLAWSAAREYYKWAECPKEFSYGY